MVEAIMFNTSRVLQTIMLFLSISYLLSCNTVENNEYGKVHIKYMGTEESPNGSVAAFQLVNDTTETIHYLAYGEGNPHYSTEVLTDSGWTYLMWNWCGTGTSPVDFEPGAKMKFTTALPMYDCTWRVILSVSIVSSDKFYTLKSEKIEYSVPK